MNGSDSSPNFDWLTKGASKKQPDSQSSQQPGFSFAPSDLTASQGNDVSRGPDTELIPGQEFDLDSASEDCSPSDTQRLSSPDDEATHLLEEAQEVPDAILNDSDGTTLIIRRRNPLDERSRSVEDDFPREEFLATAEPTSNEASKEQAPKPSSADSNVLGESVLPQVPSQAELKLTADADGELSDADADHSGDTDTFHISELIPENSFAGTGKKIGFPQSNLERPTDVDAPEQERASAGDSNLHHHRSLSVEQPAETVQSSESAVIEETALPASEGKGDLGRTEVLRQEDLTKARQTWPPLPPLGESGGSPSESEGPAFTTAMKVRKKSDDEAERLRHAGPPEVAGPSRMFVLLASYASAITIAFLALLLKQVYDNGHPHQLESLPDVPVQKENELTYVAPYSGLPRGHTLHLGEMQQFGNIEVTPLAVTEDPIEFVHYSGDAQRQRPATRPVWKLKLLLKNVSTDQQIAPLDRRLVLRRVSRAGQQIEFTNYFITERGTRDHQAPLVPIYRLPMDSDWDMAGQELGKVLAPGESYETYLAASEEETSLLPEHLVWRVQIRKGYSHSGNGVTTIFQVAFDKDQVTPEA